MTLANCPSACSRVGNFANTSADWVYLEILSINLHLALSLNLCFDDLSIYSNEALLKILES